MAGFWILARATSVLPWRSESIHKVMEDESSTSTIGGKLIGLFMDFLASLMMQEVLARAVLHIGTYHSIRGVAQAGTLTVGLDCCSPCNPVWGRDV